MATYAPEVRAHHVHVNWRLVALVALAAVVAGLAGYAIGGGFSSASNAGQDLSSRVMSAWASGDTAAMKALYAPDVRFVAERPGRSAAEVDTTRASLIETMRHAIAGGITYTQVGPAASYTTASGDMYVSSMVEVRQQGRYMDLLIGFYRVHDGKIVRQTFMDATQY